MKKEFHGFKVEKVDVPMNNIITSSGLSCRTTYDYCDAPYGSDPSQRCYYDLENNASSIQVRPYYTLIV